MSGKLEQMRVSWNMVDHVSDEIEYKYIFIYLRV